MGTGSGRRWWRRRVGGALLAAGLVALGVPGPGAHAVDTVSASGDLVAFGPNTEPLDGLTVRVLEQPGRTAVTDGNGHWQIDGLPVGSTATFVLDGGERPPIQTATFTVPAGGLQRVSIQSPDHHLYGVLEAIVAEPSRPDRCQIASTVTRRGYSVYDGAADGTHGEPFATVAISPRPSGSSGTPIYFDGGVPDTIWPDRKLTQTTPDGGVLFLNVPPGTYTLTATKPGAVIRPVTITCRAGVLANASPPWGLQVLSGGLDLDETVPFGTTTTTSPPTTTTVAPSSTTGSTTTTTGATSTGTGTGTAVPATPVAGAAAYAG